MNIAYGLAGEGRGHATRAITLAPYLLMAGHKITFFTCCQAVGPLVEEGHTVFRVPTPRIQYDKNNNPSATKTMLYYPAWFFQHRGKIIDMAKYLKDNNYDLVISDFEPLVSRAAKLANIPLILYNNQSFSTHCRLPDCCSKGDTLAKIKLSKINQMICPESNVTIIAKALPDTSLIKKRNTHLVGPPIKKEVQNVIWEGSNSKYIMVYHRASLLNKLDEIVEFAKHNDCRIKWYVAGEPVEIDNDLVDICPAGKQFITDMKYCRYLITAAGASTIGEACHIGAPIILIPEKGQIEGELNAKLTSYYYDNACTIPMSEVSAKKLTDMSSTIVGNGCNIVDGSKDVADIIDRFLQDYYSNRAS
jgi:uncharacterized protein (TIGR00661 family)